MLRAKSIQEEFLYRFTEKVIAAKKLEVIKRNLEEKELARIKRQVEIEKLKQKFSGYGQTENKEEKKEIKQTAPILKPIQPMQPRILEKKEELRPSINTPIQSAPIIQPKQEQVKQVQQQKPATKIMTIPMPSKQPPLQEGEMDLGKIRFLIRDPLVTYIECPGTEKNLIIRRTGLTTRTQITLTEEEILAIIKNFSETAKIPLIEGMLNARVANLEMSAVVSDISTNSFILKKNPIPDMNRPSSQLQKPMMQIPTMPGIPKPIMPPTNRPFSIENTNPANLDKK